MDNQILQNNKLVAAKLTDVAVRLFEMNALGMILCLFILIRREEMQNTFSL